MSTITDPQFLSGTHAKVSVAPITFVAEVGTIGSYVDLGNASWNLKRSMPNKDVSNARDGRKRIKTLGDYTGSVEGFYEVALPPESNIKEGGPYSIKLFTDGTKFYTVTALIDNLDINTQGVEDAIKVSFDFAQESGTITEPT